MKNLGVWNRLSSDTASLPIPAALWGVGGGGGVNLPGGKNGPRTATAADRPTDRAEKGGIDRTRRDARIRRGGPRRTAAPCCTAAARGTCPTASTSSVDSGSPSWPPSTAPDGRSAPSTRARRRTARAARTPTPKRARARSATTSLPFCSSLQHKKTRRFHWPRPAAGAAAWAGAAHAGARLGEDAEEACEVREENDEGSWGPLEPRSSSSEASSGSRVTRPVQCDAASEFNFTGQRVAPGRLRTGGSGALLK